VTMSIRLLPSLALAALAAACAPGAPPPEVGPAPAAAAQPRREPQPQAAPAPAAPLRARRRVLPPEAAYRLGLMPLASAGVAQFRAAHPGYDGRGVLIAILDSGVDPGVLGLAATTAGTPKILDLRDFSGEGDVPLVPVTADDAGRIGLPGGSSLSGAAAVRAAAVAPEMYGGVLSELPVGDVPAADFDGDGSNRDRYGVVVVRGRDGWLAFVDTNRDGSLADERAVADFLAGRQTFTFGRTGGGRDGGPITAAVNLTDDPARPGRPKLAFVLDTSGHGTHVTGIAAGHDLYGVPGFDGIAPGAQVIGLRIADDARGGVSTTGSMIRAMEYAARFAAERGLPLVMNMSFGIGNRIEGAAAMDSLVDAFLLRHPDVVFAISAGNDGPGTSTMGLPGSAQLALSVGALYPAAFARAQFGEGSDVLGSWSSRGGELAKPDIVAPGIAYSTVPEWDTGNEVKLGTSMAAPYATGLAALLVSALTQEGRPVRAAAVVQALRAGARRLTGETPIDQGYGVPQLEAAYAWLAADHPAPRFQVRALPAGPRHPRGLMLASVAPTGRGPDITAAYRRDGLASPGDTVQRFGVAAIPGAGAPPATYALVADRPWVRPTADVVTLDGNGYAAIEVHYDAAALARPGRYVGTVYGYVAGDSAAGPAFALVNTVVVPDTGPTLMATSRKAGAAAAARYFLRVPEGASGLAVRVAVRDTALPGALYLFEPDGRPSRGVDRLGLGGDDPATATAALSANDVVPGVWELVLQAPPTKPVGYDLRVAVPGIRITAVDSGADAPRVTLASVASADTTVIVAAEELGVTRLRPVVIRDGAPVRDTVLAPAWAKRVITEVWVPPDAWGALTDLSITLYDRDGAQLGQGPMNYPFHRVETDLPEARIGPYPVQVELFPAFAHDTAPARFPLSVRLSFEGDPRPLRSSSDGGAGVDSLGLRIPARGSTTVSLRGPKPVGAIAGWDPWVRVSVFSSGDDWTRVERYIAVRPAP
jgi:tripeptidyl-peptidase-2